MEKTVSRKKYLLPYVEIQETVSLNVLCISGNDSMTEHDLGDGGFVQC